MKAVLMSINPQWVQKIFNGEKTVEVRKRAPLTVHPYKVYVYCTQGGDPYWHMPVEGKRPYHVNGTVCGEFTCASTTEYNPPWRNHMLGTCLDAKDLYAYAAGADKLCYMAIENPILYDEPKHLADFGLERAPMSWQYIDVPMRPSPIEKGRER